MFLLLFLLQSSCLYSRLFNYTFQLDREHGDIITDLNTNPPHQITHVECRESVGNFSQCSTQLSLGFSIRNPKMVCNEMFCNLTFTTKPNQLLLLNIIYTGMRPCLDVFRGLLSILCFHHIQLTGEILLSHTFEVYAEEQVPKVDQISLFLTAFLIALIYASIIVFPVYIITH